MFTDVAESFLFLPNAAISIPMIDAGPFPIQPSQGNTQKMSQCLTAAELLRSESLP
jgi:hypothetical protein